MQLEAPHAVCGQSLAERVAETYAELAVLHAVDDSQAVADAFEEAVPWITDHLAEAGPQRLPDLYAFVHALRTDDPVWRTTLSTICKAVPPARLRMWLADNCIASTFLANEMVMEGTPMRRLDAVLDLADVPFCALDIQALMAATAEQLASAKVATSVHVGATVLAGAVGFVGGSMGHFTAGYSAGKGLDRLIDRLGKVDSLAGQASRLVLAGVAATNGGEEHAEEAAVLWAHLFDQAFEFNRTVAERRRQGHDVSALVKESRILEAAERSLQEVMKDRYAVVSAHPLPDATGTSLLAAKHLLGGINCEVDATDTTGQNRYIMSTENWYVDTVHAHSTRNKLSVGVRKFGE